MARFLVTKTSTEAQVVEARDHADAMDKVKDYQNQFLWKEQVAEYKVSEV